MKLNKQKAAVLLDAEPLPPIPSAPWVTRDDAGRVTFTDNGLEAIKLWAARGKTQAACAAELQITSRRLESVLGKADTDNPTPARLAFEAGFAQHKSSLIEKLTERALRGDSICGMFVLKAVHSLRDTGAMVEIDNSSKLQILLPGPMSEEEYFKKLGIDGPVDTRDPKLRKEAAAMITVPQLPSPASTQH